MVIFGDGGGRSALRYLFYARPRMAGARMVFSLDLSQSWPTSEKHRGGGSLSNFAELRPLVPRGEPSRRNLGAFHDPGRMPTHLL
jgi:hypothetical protein